MPWIILDRDGVINYDSLDYIKSPEEWHPLPGSLEAIGRLSQAGYHIAVATNQSGIARGYYTEAILSDIHQKMQNLLLPFNGKIDLIVHCPHLPLERCLCRKPAPGLLFEIQAKTGCDLKNVFFVGDKLSDYQAAKAAGAKSVLLRTGLTQDFEAIEKEEDFLVYLDLAEMVDILLNVGELK